MSSIQQFQEIRRDGKLIDEGMTGLDMVRAGWTPDKILVMRWVCNDRMIEMHSQFGFLSTIVASREYLAVLEDDDPEGQRTTLSVYLADGTRHSQFRNVIPVAGNPQAGIFASFRSSHSGVATAFSVLFDLYWNGARYQVEIDAVTSSILDTRETR